MAARCVRARGGFGGALRQGAARTAYGRAATSRALALMSDVLTRMSWFGSGAHLKHSRESSRVLLSQHRNRDGSPLLTRWQAGREEGRGGRQGGWAGENRLGAPAAAGGGGGGSCLVHEARLDRDRPGARPESVGHRQRHQAAPAAAGFPIRVRQFPHLYPRPLRRKGTKPPSQGTEGVPSASQKAEKFPRPSICLRPCPVHQQRLFLEQAGGTEVRKGAAAVTGRAVRRCHRTPTVCSALQLPPRSPPGARPAAHLPQTARQALDPGRAAAAPGAGPGERAQPVSEPAEPTERVKLPAPAQRPRRQARLLRNTNGAGEAAFSDRHEASFRLTGSYPAGGASAPPSAAWPYAGAAAPSTQTATEERVAR